MRFLRRSLVAALVIAVPASQATAASFLTAYPHSLAANAVPSAPLPSDPCHQGERGELSPLQQSAAAFFRQASLSTDPQPEPTDRRAYDCGAPLSDMGAEPTNPVAPLAPPPVAPVAAAPLGPQIPVGAAIPAAGTAAGFNLAYFLIPAAVAGLIALLLSSGNNADTAVSRG